jgi:hypothetical protein
MLPDLTLTGTQIAPKAVKGSDAQIRVGPIRVAVVEEEANKSDQITGTDLILTLGELTAKSGRSADPRLFFTDRFLDVNFPPGVVKQPGTGEDPEPDPVSEAKPDLTVFAAPMTNRAAPLFTHATVNGMDVVTLGAGPAPLRIYLDTTQYIESIAGVIVNIGAARPLGIDVDLSKGRYHLTRAKELRLGVQTGAGFKTAKDIVLTNVPVFVDTFASEAQAYIGSRFIREYFPDAVFVHDAEWNPKLYGRVKPELLAEPKIPRKKK